MDLEQKLQDLASDVRGRKSVKPKQEWRLPTVDDLAYGSVLAFDQTLTNCGMAHVGHDSRGLLVTVVDLLAPASRETGFKGTYSKSIELAHLVEQAIESTSRMRRIDEVVHEMPSTGGFRTESALLAGYVVQQAAVDHGLPCVMVANASMRSLLVPPERRKDKSKTPIREAIDTLFPARPDGPWNEHVRDAVGLALTRLSQIKKERS